MATASIGSLVTGAGEHWQSKSKTRDAPPAPCTVHRATSLAASRLGQVPLWMAPWMPSSNSQPSWARRLAALARRPLCQRIDADTYRETTRLVSLMIASRLDRGAAAARASSACTVSDTTMAIS